MIVCKLYNLYKIILIYHPFKQLIHFSMVDGDVLPNTPPREGTLAPETLEDARVNTPGTPGNAIIGSPSSPPSAHARTEGDSQGKGLRYLFYNKDNFTLERPSHAGRLNFNNPDQDC